MVRVHHVVTAKEKPDHTGCSIIYLLIPSVATQPQVQHITTVQEYPDLGSARTWSGIPPNVAAPLQGRSIATAQELPDHPSAAWAPIGTPPVVAAPTFRPVLPLTTAQEYPDPAPSH